VQLERFQAKWIPVRVKKTRQNKRLEPGSDSIRTDKALDAKPVPVLLILLQVKPFDRPRHHAIIAEIAEAFFAIT
jgi:hypothetical protein